VTSSDVIITDVSVWLELGTPGPVYCQFSDASTHNYTYIPLTETAALPIFSEGTDVVIPPVEYTGNSVTDLFIGNGDAIEGECFNASATVSWTFSGYVTS